jgi:hypothetical protein
LDAERESDYPREEVGVGVPQGDAELDVLLEEG